MIQSLKIAAIVLSLLLTGCAATVTKSSSNANKIQVPAVAAKKIVLAVKGDQTVSATSDWSALREELRNGMAAAAANAGMTFSFRKDDAAPLSTSEAATLVVINVNSYRYVSSGMRMMFGIMTGNASLDTDVEFSDLQSRRVGGTRKYSTSSSAWEGAFSAMTDKQVQAVCKEIVSEIANSSSTGNAGVANANYPAAPASTYTSEGNADAQVQTVAYRDGVSSTTVEKIARQNGCVGGKGAGLITPQGPVEVYRMACDSGKTFLAKCELRQCSAM